MRTSKVIQKLMKRIRMIKKAKIKKIKQTRNRLLKLNKALRHRLIRIRMINLLWISQKVIINYNLKTQIQKKLRYQTNKISHKMTQTKNINKNLIISKIKKAKKLLIKLIWIIKIKETTKLNLKKLTKPTKRTIRKSHFITILPKQQVT